MKAVVKLLLVVVLVLAVGGGVASAQSSDRRDDSAGDVRGPCDEGEHRNDPRCTGATQARANRADDDGDRQRRKRKRGSNSGKSAKSGSSGSDRSGSSSGRGCRSGDATDADDPASVRRAAEPDHLDESAGMGRMHHAPPADVHPHVPEPGEEEQVARLHAGAWHSSAQAVERVRAVRQLDS